MQEASRRGRPPKRKSENELRELSTTRVEPEVGAKSAGSASEGASEERQGRNARERGRGSEKERRATIETKQRR